MVNYGRIKNARVMQNDDEEENAQRAVNRLLRVLMGLVEAFDRRQYRGEQRFAVPTVHPLGKPSIRSKRADPATGIVDQSDTARIHPTALNNTREADPVRSMEPIEDEEFTDATVEMTTSDGLKFRTFRTSHNAHVQVDEHGAVLGKYGSSDPDFVMPLIHQIGKLGIKEENFDSDITKLALSFVRNLRPRDEIGALLGFHMAVVNEALTFNFGRVNQARFMQYNVEEENADRAVNWSARTFMALEEAFHRHQNGRKQKRTVRHMTATNGHGLAKISKGPKRGIKNVHPLIDGAVNGIEQHEVLLSKSEAGE